MRFLDLFSGIGGFRTGFEAAGHECIGFCEFDKYAVASYTSMYLINDEQRKYLETLSVRERQKEILKEKYRNGEWYSNDITKVNGGASRKQIAGASVRRARVSQWQVKGQDSTGNLVSLEKYLESCGKSQKKIDPNGLSTRTLKECLAQIEDLTTLPFSLKWTNVGTMSSGKLSTVSSSEFHKTGSVCILSDILEDWVPQKYFLSETQMQKVAFQR